MIVCDNAQRDERIMAALRAPCVSPAERAGYEVKGVKSLLDGGLPLLDVDVKRLLHPQDSERQDERFGFMLRPYWFPATTLTYRVSQLTITSSRSEARDESTVEIDMVKCQSDRVVWTEKTETLHCTGNTVIPLPAVVTRYAVYSGCACYVLSVVAPAGGAPDSSLPNREDGERLALDVLPFVYPVGPVHSGSTWTAEVGGSRITYTLVSVERLPRTTIIVVHKAGHLALSLPRDAQQLVAYVQGVCVFAPNRGLLLEERLLSRVKNRDGEDVAEFRKVKRLTSSRWG